MSNFSVNEGGFKGYAPNFKADGAQNAGMIKKVTYPQDSFNHENEGMSTTPKLLIGAGIVSAIALGIWACVRGKGIEGAKKAVKKGKEALGNAVDNAKKNVKNNTTRRSNNALRNSGRGKVLPKNPSRGGQNPPPPPPPGGGGAAMPLRKLSKRSQNMSSARKDTKLPEKGKFKIRKNAEMSGTSNKTKHRVKTRMMEVPNVSPIIMNDSRYRKLSAGALNFRKAKLLVVKKTNGNTSSLISLDGIKPYTGKGVKVEGKTGRSVYCLSLEDGIITHNTHFFIDKGRVRCEILK